MFRMTPDGWALSQPPPPPLQRHVRALERERAALDASSNLTRPPPPRGSDQLGALHGGLPVRPPAPRPPRRGSLAPRPRPAIAPLPAPAAPPKLRAPVLFAGGAVSAPHGPQHAARAPRARRRGAPAAPAGLALLGPRLRAFARARAPRAACPRRAARFRRARFTPRCRGRQELAPWCWSPRLQHAVLCVR